MGERVLVADDEAVLRDNVVRFLRRAGHDADGVGTGEEALERMAEAPYGVLITDLRMPGMGGLKLLEQVAQRHPETSVLVITAYASIESAVGALRLGAQDYLLKPLSLQEVARKVAHLAEHRALQERVQWLRRELQEHHPVRGMVADAPAMRPVMRLVRKAAQTRSNVLVEGESGTGKELIARALHDLSPWSDQPFVAVNLAAQPPDLVDATLFGHERGAFTGAQGRRDGVFRAARGGTVFLDEIGELPLAVQVKLLRVLESREVLPLGADRALPVDFRLVAATNRSLAEMVAAGTFREDLFFRLDVLWVSLPPLRDRREDLPALCRRFIQAHAADLGRPAPQLSREAVALVRAHPWPGNVRELSNALERAVLLADGAWITPDDLPMRRGLGRKGGPTNLKDAVALFEGAHVTRVLADCDGDKSAAAEALGVHLATLYRHLERLGV